MEMKELTSKQLLETNGGILSAFLVGAAIGALAKKLYNKYQANKAAEAAATANNIACASNPNCA